MGALQGRSVEDTRLWKVLITWNFRFGRLEIDCSGQVVEDGSHYTHTFERILLFYSLRISFGLLVRVKMGRVRVGSMLYLECEPELLIGDTYPILDGKPESPFETSRNYISERFMPKSSY